MPPCGNQPEGERYSACKPDPTNCSPSRLKRTAKRESINNLSDTRLQHKCQSSRSSTEHYVRSLYGTSCRAGSSSFRLINPQAIINITTQSLPTLFMASSLFSSLGHFTYSSTFFGLTCTVVLSSAFSPTHGYCVCSIFSSCSSVYHIESNFV